MESLEYARMFEAEDNHWWYLGMEALTRSLLTRWIKPGGDLRILDAGCGTGAAMQTCLAPFGRVFGIDLTSVALGFCRLRKVERLAQTSVGALPFAPASFDLLTSFDVLYIKSVPDVVGALNEFYRILKPAGLLLLRLPAYDWLRGSHDLAVSTARRFTIGEVVRSLMDCGFSIKHSSYANTFLFPLALVKRLAEQLFHPAGAPSELQPMPRLVNNLFRRVLSAEAPLVTRTRLPYGLSLYVVAQKP